MVYLCYITFFLLLYIYFWYFISIYILARFFPFINNSKNKIEEFPLVSIIIPVRNEELAIQKKLLNTLELEYPSSKLEIIVIDSASTDTTQAIVSSPQFKWKISLRSIEHLWKAFALEKGINDFSKWDFILVTDVSAVLEKNSLKNALKYFELEKVAWVTCSLRQEVHSTHITSSGKKYWQMESLLRRYESFFYSCIGFTGKFSLFRKEVFKNKQWYFPSDADDFDMALFIIKHWGRVIQWDDIIAFEKAPNSISDVTMQRQRIIVQTMYSLFHYRTLLTMNRYGFILFSRKFLPLLSPILFSLFFISFAFLAFGTNLFLPFAIFLIFLGIVYIWKIQISFLKFLYYVILLNIVICKSYLALLAWRDFTKWDKISSTRI